MAKANIKDPTPVQSALFISNVVPVQRDITPVSQNNSLVKVKELVPINPDLVDPVVTKTTVIDDEGKVIVTKPSDLPPGSTTSPQKPGIPEVTVEPEKKEPVTTVEKFNGLTTFQKIIVIAIIGTVLYYVAKNYKLI